MTSLCIDYLDRRAKEHQALVEDFIPWCQQHGWMRLSDWMTQHQAETQDLYLAGLIGYTNPDCLPDSMSIFTEPYITGVGRHVICPYEHGMDCADPSLCYVVDPALLYELVSPYLSRTKAQRKQDYIDEYTARHGYAPQADDFWLVRRYGE